MSILDRLAAAGLPGLPRMAWLEIDLGRLEANLAALRRALPEGNRLDVVVKADAYGHGAVPIARALEGFGRPPEGLAVATFDEAVELREAGLELPILVLYPVPPERAPEAARRRIALTASDPELLERTLASLERARFSARAAGRRRSPHRLDLQIELESGLGRAGILPAEVPAAAARIMAAPGVHLAGIWSHLQAPADRVRSAGQVALLTGAIGRLAEGGIQVPLGHLGASGGVLAGSSPPFDGVRIGLGLYGLLPDELPEVTGPPATPGEQLAGELQPILALHARPVRVVDLPAGSGISYGPSFTTSRPSRIATLPIGYADGWSRSLSNRAEALVRGRRVPLVGTVAMDALMADVTDLPGPAVTVDDEFVLIGGQGNEEISAAEVARARTTISWEVVSAMARRLPRVYYAGLVPLSVRTLAGWRQSGSDSTLERRHLRARGRRDR